MKAKMKGGNGRSPQKQKRNWLPIGLLLVGLLFVVGVAYSFTTRLSASAASASYTAADVAVTQPILAGHAMNEGSPIPFLPKNEPQPNIQLSETTYDFGTIGPLDVVTRQFVIRNTGEAPLTISRAYTTCGCTTAEFSASVIPPGKVATVDLIYDAGFHNTAGQSVRRGLIIENNDPDQSQAEIWIQATVRAK